MRRATAARLGASVALVIAAATQRGPAVSGFEAPQSFADSGRAAELEKFVPTREEIAQAYQRAQQADRSDGRVYKDRISPHWFTDSTRFWYRNDLRGGQKEFILVNAQRGTRDRAFDHEKLAAALSRATKTEHSPNRLPFDEIEFIDDASTIRFTVGDAAWDCNLASYECSERPRSKQESSQEPFARERTFVREPRRAQQDGSRQDRPRRGQGQLRFGNSRPEHGASEEQREIHSPDGQWTALVRDHNVHIRGRNDDHELQLSQNGTDALAYGMLQWAPDSKTLVAFRIDPGERKEVFLIQSSPPGGGRALLQSRPYALPGDKFTAFELNLFRLDTAIAETGEARPRWTALRTQVDRIDFGIPRLHWKRDGRTFLCSQTDRGHQRFRVVEVDGHTGQARNIVDERTNTFIWTAHTEGMNLSIVYYLDRTDEIIYVSEHDGWRHLYLIDTGTTGTAAAGANAHAAAERAMKFATLKNQITRGEFVVRGIDRIDEENRQIWFRAGGMNADQDPYFIHFYRVNFDGTGLVALTEGNGTHSIQFSPDRRYIIDTYSRVDMPPVHELRRAENGNLIMRLEEADSSELTESRWQAPEVFVAKGRDGATDIWGIIQRPREFDPNKRYPIIEEIYAGPHGSFVPKSFRAIGRNVSLTDLAFIVVRIDGMGTANRSKAFHDVCWKNLKDAGFPDRILWIKAAAAQYPYMDTSRVGIYGHSAGGQSAAAAVLFHPEFYKVAVASCGCHDNRMDKASWNEQWMGYPVGPHYAECSNIENAHRLRGKLLLMVGELDTNVPPESTLRFADALIKAGKDFELLVIPGAAHSIGGSYGDRRRRDFFVRHLHGAEPPDHNAYSTPPASNASVD